MLVDKMLHHDTWLCRDAEDDEAPLTEGEKASQWDDFTAFRDDRLFREVDMAFGRVFRRVG